MPNTDEEQWSLEGEDRQPTQGEQPLSTEELSALTAFEWRRKYVGNEWKYAQRRQSTDKWSEWKTQLAWAQEGQRTPRKLYHGRDVNSYANDPLVQHVGDPSRDVGEEVDERIALSPIKDWSGKQALAKGKMHVYEELEYEARAVLDNELGNSDAPSVVRAKAEDKALVTNAFRVSKPGQANPPGVHLSKRRGQAITTAIHEGLHLYSNPSFLDTFFQWPNEGATEYFTLIVCKSNGLERGPVDYDAAADAIDALVKWLDACGESGRTLLVNAYFKGDVYALVGTMSKHWQPVKDPDDKDKVLQPKDWFLRYLTQGGEARAVELLSEVNIVRDQTASEQAEKDYSDVIRYWPDVLAGNISRSDFGELTGVLKSSFKSLDTITDRLRKEKVDKLDELIAEVSKAYKS